jgi:hypothetical protein
MVRRWCSTLLPVILVLSAACSGSQSPNLFHNPSFEEGDQPWTSLTTEGWGPRFTLSDQVAHSGQHSAFLAMRATEAAGTQIFGVVQEVQPREFPDVVSGYYRIGDWTRGTDVQYLQFAVIVFGAKNMPGGYPNYQIRYVLAGTSQPPFLLANAKFIFVGTDEPVPNDWVHFQREVRQDFMDQWGAVPEGFSTIRVLFEVRYDSKPEGVTAPKADVFFDDLYLGPAEASPP